MSMISTKYLPETHFLFLPLVLPLMSEDLAAGVQHIVAVGSDAVDMVAGLAKPAVAVRTGLILHVLLKAILRKRLIFYMISFMFLCKEPKCYENQIVLKSSNPTKLQQSKYLFQMFF